MVCRLGLDLPEKRTEAGAICGMSGGILAMGIHDTGVILLVQLFGENPSGGADIRL